MTIDSEQLIIITGSEQLITITTDSEQVIIIADGEQLITNNYW